MPNIADAVRFRTEQELRDRIRRRRDPNSLGGLTQPQDLGLDDPQIQQLLQPVQPFGALRQAIQTPLNSLLDLVGLPPGPSQSSQPTATGGTPPTFGQGGPSGKEILGRTLSGLGTSLPLLLLAKNNPAMARGATEQANVQSQQNLQRLQQILQERRSRRQEGLQRDQLELDRGKLDQSSEISQINTLLKFPGAKIPEELRDKYGLPEEVPRDTNMKIVEVPSKDEEGNPVTKFKMVVYDPSDKSLIVTDIQGLEGTRERSTKVLPEGGKLVDEDSGRILASNKGAPGSEIDVVTRRQIHELQDFQEVINQIQEDFDPSFTGMLQGNLSTPVRVATGVGLTPRRARFARNVKSLRNRILQLRSGATITPEEASRLLDEIGTLSDADANFEVKMATIASELDGMIKRRLTGNLESIRRDPQSSKGTTTQGEGGNTKRIKMVRPEGGGPFQRVDE